MSKEFFHSMLMPIFSQAREPDLDRALLNAIAVSRWLKADLHLLVERDSSTLRRKLAEHSFNPKAIISMVHESKRPVLEDVLDLVRHHEIDLLMFGMNSIPIEEPFAEQWQGLILQIADVPVLICPLDLDLAQSPIRSLLVPMSGEVRISASLEVALRLANEVNSPVDLIHVTDIDAEAPGPSSPLESGSEHFYHEYPKLLDQLIAQSSPYSEMRDRLVIRSFQHGCGYVADEILKCVGEKASSLLVLEWKGSLASGRARTIKSAMARHSFPILLIREVAKQRSVLKVGNHFNAA
jgi:nucleotide-binding universal stress UspA family protein